MFYLDVENTFETRYDMAKFMGFTMDFFDVINSYFIAQVKQLNVGGKRLVQGEDGRPDLLSYRIYGKTQYWWILMFYNDYLTPEDIVTGNLVKYPSLNDLEDLYFTLNAKALGR